MRPSRALLARDEAHAGLLPGEQNLVYREHLAVYKQNLVFIRIQLPEKLRAINLVLYGIIKINLMVVKI